MWCANISIMRYDTVSIETTWFVEIYLCSQVTKDMMLVHQDQWSSRDEASPIPGAFHANSTKERVYTRAKHQKSPHLTFFRTETIENRLQLSTRIHLDLGSLPEWLPMGRLRGLLLNRYSIWPSEIAEVLTPNFLNHFTYLKLISGGKLKHIQVLIALLSTT